MIIIEGADNSGKSMLGKTLKRALRLPLIHPGGPPKSDEDRFDRMVEQLWQVKKDVIYDRVTCFSDPVYRQRLDEPFFAVFRHEMIKRGAKLIFCRPPDHILMDVQNHPLKEHDNIEQVELVKKSQPLFIQSYDNMMKLYPHVIYDFTTDSVDSILMQIGG